MGLTTAQWFLIEVSLGSSQLLNRIRNFVSNPRTSVVCFFLLLLYCLAEQNSTSPPLAENIASVTSSPPCVNSCIPVPSLLAIHTILSQKLFLKCLMNTIFFPSGEYRGLEN